MAGTLRRAAPAAVRALIARLWLGERLAAPPRRAGSIVLRPHQRSALQRLRRMLGEYGGALLADDVGLGKTYIAAALAREYDRVLVVTPAALRDMWHAALRDVGAKGSVVSYATLSRGGGPRERFDLVLLDEAHHARTPGTRRYARIAQLTDGAHLLMLSATPVHNSRRDLTALLALFLGARALALDDDALATHVIRRERYDLDAEHLPAIAEPVRLEVGDDEALLRAILALPPPLPPRDAGAGGALVVWGLVREWASSNAALEGALRRRLARAGALAAALDGGRLPTRQELTAWVCADRSVQLAFPELLDSPVASDSAALRSVLARHEHAVRALLQRARASAWTDVRRAVVLRELRLQHRGEKIVAFTQFADTARALFREMRRDSGVAVLTGRGASVAGGALSRREAIQRFAPRASRTRAPRAIERIDLLIATDILSEGINLHDASVVVHLDLPWTPARLEQRVGRSRRMGALHARTSVYVLQPPASAEELLRVEQRLHAKLGAAERLLGAADGLLAPADVPLGAAGGLLAPAPALLAGADRLLPKSATAACDSESRVSRPARPAAVKRASAARRRELIVRQLERWREEGGADPSELTARGVVVSITRAASSALLALVSEGGEHRLVAAKGDREVDDDPALVLEVVHLASGARVPSRARASDWGPLPADPGPALDRVARWASRRAAKIAAGSELEPYSEVRKRALRRVAAIAARAPRHRRAEVMRLAGLARRAALAPYGVGAERALEELVAAEEVSGERWLHSLGEFGAERGCDRARSDAPVVEPVAVMILMG